MTKPASYSGLSTFDNCPRQFYETVETKNVPYRESEAQKKGKREHQAFHLRIKGGVPLPDHLQAHEALIAGIERSGAATHAELSLGAAADFAPREFFDKDVWFRGQLDFVAVNRTNAVVIDWKDGNPNYEKPFQLETQALLVMLHQPTVAKVTAANVWLKTGQKGVPHVYTRDTLASTKADLVSRVGAIERCRAAGRWPELAGALCAYCNVAKCQSNRNPNL